jgi:hypothetical protein
VSVDTSEFAALTGRLDDLERQVDELAGYHRKAAVNVAALMVDAGMLSDGTRATRALTPRRRAARHVRAVDGSAS